MKKNGGGSRGPYAHDGGRWAMGYGLWAVGGDELLRCNAASTLGLSMSPSTEWGGETDLAGEGR